MPSQPKGSAPFSVFRGMRPRDWDWNAAERCGERAIGVALVAAGVLGGAMMPIPWGVGPMWASIHPLVWLLIAADGVLTLYCLWLAFRPRD